MARPRRDGNPSRVTVKKDLTDPDVKGIKNAAGFQHVYDKTDGLSLAVYPLPSDRKVWRFTYRHGGRVRVFTMGKYPAIGLADARKAAKILAGRVAAGEDPQGEKRTAATSDTVAELIAEYLAAMKGLKSIDQKQRILNKYALPKWKHRKAREITRSDVKALFRAVTENHGEAMANQVVLHLSGMFTWAEKEEVAGIEKNPCKGVDGNETHARERVLADAELPALWNALEDAEGYACTALRILLLTGQRPGEVAAMRHEHISGNWWNMPGEKVPALKWPGTKNSKSHRVWLSDEVLRLIALLGDGSTGPVFPGMRRSKMNDAINAAYEKLGIPPVTPHDLRRSHGTMTTSLRFSRDMMDRIQNHIKGGIASVYDRHGYALELQEVQEAVGELVKALIAGDAKRARALRSGKRDRVADEKIVDLDDRRAVGAR